MSLVDHRGQLNSEAVGWMRHPLVDTSGIGGKTGWGRNKRWEYWCVFTPTHIIALTVSSLDYAGVYEIWVYDRKQDHSWGKTAITPLRSVRLPKSLHEGDINVSVPGLYIGIHQVTEGVRLRGKISGAAFEVLVRTPPEHESLGVVVPWSRTLFQYTVKDLGLPASGWVRTGDTAAKFAAGAFAVLDHGRGRWPREIEWNWGTATGTVGALNILFAPEYLAEHPDAKNQTYTVGVQLGAKWTDGTGITENAIFFGDKIYKIHQDVSLTYDLDDWRSPWRISGGGIELQMKPFHNKKSRTDLKYISSRTDQVFGTFSGMLDIPGVGKVMVTDFLGFAEEVKQLW